MATLRALTLTAAAALLLVSGTAHAADKPKQKAAAKGTTLTVNDIRVCMGVDGSSPDDQIPACTKVINSGKVRPPHHGDYYATRGAAYFAKGDIEKAMADLNKAISIRQAPEFYFQRALVQLAKREIEAGKADLDQVIKLKPDFAQSYLIRGIVAYNEAEYADALKHFESAVQRVPSMYVAIFARGVTKMKLGDIDAGEKDIKQARGMSSQVDKDLEKFGLKP